MSMPTQHLFALDVSTLGSPWALVVFGLVSAGLGLCLGRAVFSRRAALPTSPAPVRSGADLRTCPRYPAVQGRALLLPMAGPGEAVECWLVDCSLGGVGLSADRHVEAGSIWQLKAPGRGGSELPDRVQVKYCRLHRGRWRLGCQFLDRTG
jgi:hypothetical protein